MRVKVTRSQVTTTIDPYLKAAFEATREKHQLDYSEVLEKGIEEVLKEVDPISFLEHKASRLELEHTETLQDVSRLKLMKDLQPPKDEDIRRQEELEKHREALFAKDERSFRFQWPDKINWARVIDRYQFENKSEAMEFLRKKIKINEGDL